MRGRIWPVLRLLPGYDVGRRVEFYRPVGHNVLTECLLGFTQNVLYLFLTQVNAHDGEPAPEVRLHHGSDARKSRPSMVGCDCDVGDPGIAEQDFQFRPVPQYERGAQGICCALPCDPIQQSHLYGIGL